MEPTTNINKAAQRSAHRAENSSPVNIPNSPVPGVAWPALPGHYGALQLALQFQYEQTQWWSPGQLREFQFRQLRLLLDFAARNVPFYRDRLGAAGAPPLDARSWAALPTLTRTQIQEAGEALFSRALPPGHTPVAVITTSGSTGRPVTVRSSAIAQTFFKALNLRNHLWQRRDLSAKSCAIRFMKPEEALPPDGRRGRGWAPAFGAGPACSLNVFSGLDDQIDWLEREAPAYLLTYPTNIAALVRRMAERGVTLPSLRDVGTFGETITPEIRTLVSSCLGVPVIDTYSAMEAGVLALQCPGRERYHVMAENFLVEVLDSRNEACAPGEIGRVVVTPLHNFATPLIRYEIGDWAEAGAPCECGRGLPVLERIVGRTRNMLVMPDGEKRWPGVRISELAAGVPFKQIQIVQRTRTGILTRLVVPRAVTAEEEQRMRERINAILGAPFEVSFEYPAEIARSAGGKFEDFRSEAA